MEEHLLQTYLPKDSKSLKFGEKRFQFIPTQIEVEKLLNDLEKDDQILLLRCLGVREIKIEEITSSSSNNDNPKQAFSTFLKEWDFFQTPLQTITCIRRIYRAQHQNQQEIPLKFFNKLTINQFSTSFENFLAPVEIQELSFRFEIENSSNQIEINKYIQENDYFKSIENLREFDSLLRFHDPFDRLRFLIGEAIFYYSGEFMYASFTSLNRFTLRKILCDIVALCFIYSKTPIPKKLGVKNDDEHPKVCVPLLKWNSNPADNNYDAINHLFQKSSIGNGFLSFEINLDGPVDHSNLWLMETSIRETMERFEKWDEKMLQEKMEANEISSIANFIVYIFQQF